MECRAGVVLGVAGGYLLGRSKKLRVALILASVAALRGPGRSGQVSTTTFVTDGPDNIAPIEMLEDTSRVRFSEVALPDEAAADEGEFHDRAVNAFQQARATEVDNVDGSEVFEAVMFSLDGRHYRLDLPTDKAAKLRDALAPFVAVARLRRGGGTRRRGRSAGAAPQPQRSSGDQKKNAAIREWARQRGHELSRRGPIPASVLEAYKNDVG